MSKSVHNGIHLSGIDGSTPIFNSLMVVTILLKAGTTVDKRSLGSCSNESAVAWFEVLDLLKAMVIIIVTDLILHLKIVLCNYDVYLGCLWSHGLWHMLVCLHALAPEILDHKQLVWPQNLANSQKILSDNNFPPFLWYILITNCK